MKSLLVDRIVSTHCSAQAAVGGSAAAAAGSDFAALMEREGGHERGASSEEGARPRAAVEGGEGDRELATVGELLAQRRLPLAEPAMVQLAESRPLGGAALDLGAVEQLLRSVAIETIGERSSVRIEVGAAKLDSLKISLRWDGQRLHARFELSDAQQLKLVRSAVGELEEALRERGLPSQKVEVGLSSRSGGEGRDGRGGGEDPENDRRVQRERAGRPLPSLLRRSSAKTGLA